MSLDNYSSLTVEIIDSTSDDDLLFDIFDNMCGQMAEDVEEDAAILALNPPRQAIYLIFMLEGEINNGGFNQYYHNSSGKFYKYLPAALRKIGANLFAELTQKANEVYEREHQKITQTMDGTLEGFSKSYEDNPLNEFDDEFYALYSEENLQQLQIDYIRTHKYDFIRA